MDAGGLRVPRCSGLNGTAASLEQARRLSRRRAHPSGITGNHDFVFQRAADSVPADLPWTHRQDGATVVRYGRYVGRPTVEAPWSFRR